MWTNVLKKNIIHSFYKELPLNEQKKYYNEIFPEIRNLTRYTYPDTVKSKNNLEKMNKIKFIKDKVTKIIKKRNSILIKTKNKLNIKSDLLINVSGPMNILKKKTDLKIVDSLKKINSQYNERGFYTGKNFNLNNCIYAPGTLSYNFNPLRETIIKAITNNVHQVVKNIIKKNRL